MKFFSVLPLAAMAAAEMTVMSIAPAAVSGAATHTVTVGGVKPAETGGVVGILQYQPESINAAVGDKVKFIFMQKNHTVTQSTFAEPCAKMANGMDSGFMPNPDGAAGVEWEMEVKTTEALWFYCKQKTGVHCGKGMVFAINPSTVKNTMSEFKQLAIQKNGTEALTVAAIASPPATANAVAASTVTVVAGGGEVAASATGTATAALASATVAVGQGQDGNGNACTCHCLCGVNSFPASAGINAFGGFGGMIPAGSP
ncbi:hypothetical protein P154DRAFT_137243 [Amniculicola lignicola CBS 123094]|uniref:Cupredoxin n=1 Tax=Amniculicola lignicola CBS 123094 TaxID=1392246 RepID=A0A6A5WLM3_9PLEO|nr:hypothetical protein P154DRAFT_137243 [Amniculicola lignicola CBS 123094]